MNISKASELNNEAVIEKTLEQEALDFHARPKPGKLEVNSSKSTSTEKALSLAYSPGVAAPCKIIAKNPDKVYDYTIKGNLVAVISNGTAVLGLGNIGPLASKPVMEGKAVLFKQFAGIDVFDIELNTLDVDSTVAAVKALEPTFGGINLEDIKAPECFEIEEQLKKIMKIPVFHDDQHGTAIVSGAAMINACHITGRKLEDLKIVMNGAGASSIACAKIFVSLGVRREHITMCDTSGTIYAGRKDGMNKYKELFAVETKARTLAQALVGADMFVGLSAAGALTGEMIKPMAKNPIIFAMANPDPEISPKDAHAARPDCIMATGRSDYPNQVNNVLGFPAIFRGALDTRAEQINEAMKLAAVEALATLAREDVPDHVSASYGGKSFKYGKEYLIPKPFDPRVLLRVAPAVAKASMDSGVARKQITDFEAYRDSLESFQGPSKVFIRSAIHKVRANTSSNNGEMPAIIFPEGASSKILKAVSILVDEQICRPILLGYPDQIADKIKSLEIHNLDDVQKIQPSKHEQFKAFAQELHKRRARKGVQSAEADRLLRDPNYFAAMMVDQGQADGMVTGASVNFADAVRPILQTIGTARDGVAAGMNLVLLEDRFLLLADTTVNFDPSAEQLATIALQCARICEYFEVQPRIAMLSYSNFTGVGSSPSKMKKAVELVKAKRPDILVDGEMQADTAVSKDIQKRIFPFCDLKDGANILIFPNLESSNIAYKLLQQLGKGEVIGPFLMGIRRSANVLQRTTTVDAIVNSVVLTCLESQYLKERRKRLQGSTN
jgi:malate dehydrogenase (oxaloacetate-decarboxylating)(NADP+)